MLSGTLDAILLENMLAGVGIKRAGYGHKVDGIFRAGYRYERSSIKKKVNSA